MIRGHSSRVVLRGWRLVAWSVFLFTAVRPACADNVELTLRDGRVTIVADHATPAQILEAWARLGGVTLVNAERVQALPITLRVDDMPEEQALDILLRSTGGYLARRRDSAASGSVFDRIVITASAAGASAAQPSVSAPPASGGVRPVFPQPPPPVAAPLGTPAPPAPPAAQNSGIRIAPGVTRLVGPDGRPVADDQDDAPSPPPQSAQPAPTYYPAQVPQPAVQPQPQQGTAPPVATPSTSAPAGVSRPGMAAPDATPPPTPGQPRR